LNKIRNTIAGHISIDFRIACAMHNFTFKPCVVDSSNSEKIAKEIRIKADNLTTNKLDFLLYKHFGTKDLEEMPLDSITDFPKIKKKILKRKIFLGSYQLKSSSSYLGELIRNNIIYITSDEYNNYLEKNNFKLKESKIVAAKINPRHSRSLNKSTSLKNLTMLLSSIYRIKIILKEF